MILTTIFKIKTAHNLTFSILKSYYSLKPDYKETKKKIDNLIKKYESKILYSSLIESRKLKFGYKGNKIILSKLVKQENKVKQQLATIQPIPISLKYLSHNTDEETVVVESSNETFEKEEGERQQPAHFPYESNVFEIETAINNKLQPKELTDAIEQEIRGRWMTSYDNYDDSLKITTEPINEDNWSVNYGTPDPNSNISDVPCGGCGALLHCKDKSIPGYIPSEIFKNDKRKGGSNLQALICQRCHFLKYYNLALQMRVSPDDYPKVLVTIKERRPLVVLIVDLLDFPCSIWPGIADIFGSKVPIVIVGNKVDLLPQDSSKYLTHIKQVLLDNVRLSGFAMLNIKHVALISAKTGYGIEELITTLWSLFQTKGDVYVVGCTNVGKSTLFNTLLQSDYCKIQAIDLIQRATTSVWPGTTLNLLKFPIKRPSGYRQYLRHQRLLVAKKILDEVNDERKEMLKLTKDPKYATLVGRVDLTKSGHKEIDETKDYFHLKGNSNATGKVMMGLNETNEDYIESKWCYDTPGVVQPDQITHLLTTEELLIVLPKQLIIPQTFCLNPGTSLFIAGLARLDFIQGPDFLRLTTFASNELPITICKIQDANELYQNLLGTDFFKVPTTNPERLRKWSGLEASQVLTVTGVDRNKSCNDIVLSSAGWVAITGAAGTNYQLQAWTPEKRGIYLRDSLLPYAVTLRGARIKRSVAYKRHKFYLK